jgi:hypothetical protein
MEALDGNSLAGPLFEHYGAEMTAISGTCTHCGATALIAQLVVYLRAPGAVARCPSCGQVVMVVVSVADHALVDDRSFAIAGEQR